MKRNAFFQLVHKQNGTYLKSYPASEGGEPLKADDILSYLAAKRFDNVTVETVKKFIQKASEEKNAEVRISVEDAIPENEYAVITVDPERRYAKIRMYPNSNLGSRLSVRDILSLAEQRGVRYGIIQRNIEILHKTRLYCTDVLLARATMPVHGHDAVITYHFNVEKTNKPAVGEDGQVDFHKLDMIEPVKEGQLLATLELADFGTPGTDVTGAEIRPRKVAVRTLKHGKHIRLSEDSLAMYSEIAGNVTCVDGTVFVSDCFEVPADVGPSTGDIDYDGSVEVKGNVLTGYTVRADGDIYVNGAVEGANLIAGGKIVLKRGIQGKGRGRMEAGGDIISNFIESSQVVAGGKIVTDAIMHSRVVAKDTITVNGKRGLIAGGSIRSTQKIETKVAGSSMGTQTELEVGVDPDIVDRYHEIEMEMEKLSDEKETVLQTVELLNKRFKQTGSLSAEKLGNLKRSKERTEEIEQAMELLTEEYDMLEKELENSSGHGKIVVHDVAYAGVKLTIANITNYLHNQVQHSTFVREGADIRTRGI